MPRLDAHHSSRRRTIQLSSLEREHNRQIAENSVLHGVGGTQQKKSMAHVSSSTVQALKRSFLVLSAAVLVVFSPAAIYAQEITDPPPADPPVSDPTPPPPEPAPAPPPPPPTPVPAPPAATPAPPSNQGPQQPPGPDAKKYTYNAQTDLWESEPYTWDPVTKQTKPKNQPTYSYNPTSGMWDTTEWRYNAPTGTYVPNVVSTNNAPLQTPGSDPADSTSNYMFDLFYNASISNNVNSNAQSGNALVSHNTTGGDALTGNALAMANIFNLLQSSAGFLGGGNITTFSSDINGDVFGDLFVDPAILASLQPAPTSENSNVDLNVDFNGQINNNIALNAATGNATVEGNTTAGDATTGNAHAVANVVNMLNSAISTGGSFMGMLNIYGNLNGDILLPEGLLNTLLASDAAAPATTTLGEGNVENSELLAEFNNNQSINNNVNAAATSGDATVDHNTTAGSATTGDASTNVTVLNLTGRQIVGANSLLVFVNVLGKWVGVIMDAPTGSTTAALGSGITENSGGSTHAEADFNTASQINNNIDVTAATGDATVQNNTKAGNAKTGNATASVNLLNIMNSSLSFSDWFGVLFINVFGTWNGSFGLDTDAGETPAAPASTVAATSGGSGSESVKVFKFVPTGQGTQRLARVGAGEGGEGAEQAAQAAAQVLGATAPANTSDDDDGTGGGVAQANAAVWIFPAIGLLAGSALLGAERFAAVRSRRRLAL